MKTIIIALACALVAPLAFAQTTQETTTTTTEPGAATQTTTTYSSGTVTTYEPGKTIVVKGPEGPVSFVLHTAANIVDGAGKIVTARCGPAKRCASTTAAPATLEWFDESWLRTNEITQTYAL